MNTVLLGALLLLSSGPGEDLRGSLLVAADGAFLGVCGNAHVPYSLNNAAGPYGGKRARYSISNPSGPYGNQSGLFSAYNPGSDAAPYLVPADAKLLALLSNPHYHPSVKISLAVEVIALGRVSKNSALPRAIDPDALKTRCAAGR